MSDQQGRTAYTHGPVPTDLTPEELGPLYKGLQDANQQGVRDPVTRRIITGVVKGIIADHCTVQTGENVLVRADNAKNAEYLRRNKDILRDIYGVEDIAIITGKPSEGGISR